MNVEHGIPFHVMSKHGDGSVINPFHLPFDQPASILTTQVLRHFVIRNDYVLYEYAVVQAYLCPRLDPAHQGGRHLVFPFLLLPQ